MIPRRNYPQETERIANKVPDMPRNEDWDVKWKQHHYVCRNMSVAAKNVVKGFLPLTGDNKYNECHNRPPGCDLISADVHYGFAFHNELTFRVAEPAEERSRS